jgi:hypothetical protein
MEKEKPYKCDVCYKRYKNLNGLKYVSPCLHVLASLSKQHKQHSPSCNPDLKMTPGGLGGLGVNLAALPGIGEEMA